MGFWIGQIDWLGKKNGEWIKFEIKRKERFLAPPFEGHGLNKNQADYSLELQKDTKIRTLLMIYEKPTVVLSNSGVLPIFLTYYHICP